NRPRQELRCLRIEPEQLRALAWLVFQFQWKAPDFRWLCWLCVSLGTFLSSRNTGNSHPGMQSQRVFANPPASSIQAAIKIATLWFLRKLLFLRKPPRSLWFSKLGYDKRLKDLFSYSEPLNDTAITFSVLRLNIVQKPASVAYHLEEASPGGMILLVS